MPLITEQEVQKFLTKLDITKAIGLDNNEAKFLKQNRAIYHKSPYGNLSLELWSTR